MPKCLAAFDFDHTIADDNTDTVVAHLLNRYSIPDSLKQLHKSDGWTAFMQGIFELLHKYNIGKHTITKAVVEIPPVSGIPELLRELSTNSNFDVIIISDSNSYFIEAWLAEHKLDDAICQIFTNPAVFVDEILKIEMHHLQDSCTLSTKNLCKGQVLEDFIKRQKENGRSYDFVIYVGDGVNDLCPILRLGEKDLGCVRENYKLSDLVNLVQEGKPVEKTGEIYSINSQICFWKTGFDILNAINTRVIR